MSAQADKDENPSNYKEFHIVLTIATFRETMVFTSNSIFRYYSFFYFCNKYTFNLLANMVKSVIFKIF